MIDGGVNVRRPSMLPDGSGVLYGTTVGIMLLELGADSARLVIPGGTDAMYVETGHLVYGHTLEGGLYAVPFDLADHTVIGNPVPVRDDVDLVGADAFYSISRTCTLVYATNPLDGADRRLSSSCWICVAAWTRSPCRPGSSTGHGFPQTASGSHSTPAPAGSSSERSIRTTSLRVRRRRSPLEVVRTPRPGLRTEPEWCFPRSRRAPSQRTCSSRRSMATRHRPDSSIFPVMTMRWPGHPRTSSCSTRPARRIS